MPVETVKQAAPWLIPGQGTGDVLRAQYEAKRRGDEEQARLGMEQQQFKAQQAHQAQRVLAQKQFNDALKGLDPKDPDYQKKASALILQFGPLLGMGGAGAAGALKAFTPPITASPLIPGMGNGQQSPAPTPAPQGAPSGAFQDTEKIGTPGATPAPQPSSPQPPAAPAPGSAPVTWAQPPMMLSNGRVVPGKLAPPPPQMRPIPRGAVGMGPNGLITNSVPSIPPRPTVTKPGDVVLQDGKPIYTNTQPKAVTGPAPLPRPLSVKEFETLTPEEQTNYVHSVYQAQTNRLGNSGSWKPQPLPMPSKKEDLKKGQIYTTGRGEATWDEKFVQP